MQLVGKQNHLRMVGLHHLSVASSY